MDCNDDLRRARSSLAEAELARRPSDRYLAAHLAALRVVAIVLTHRAPPGTGRLEGRPRNAWRMLAEVAPELAEWAAFFAATESRRDAIRARFTASAIRIVVPSPLEGESYAVAQRRRMGGGLERMARDPSPNRVC